ncbi:MAG: D-alanyl-D-alanine carboxypeptidase, partial [Chloroflexi bacterium]|nr:D-alanyl-D-alanine carboxypeptidase [Chloroflexota bacterium]
GAATPPPPPPPPALQGSLPNDGGFGLVVWAGGGTNAIATAAEAGGCTVRSVWVTDQDGGFIHFHFGAPEFVNAAWAKRFPAGEVPGGIALLARCDAGGNAASSALRATPAAASADVVALPLVPAAAVPPPQRSGPRAIPNVSAYAGAIVDAASGAVLWEKRAHEPLAPASLTKIATAVLAIERGNLDASVPIDVDARLMTDSTVMGLRPSDCFRMRDLLYGLMLTSGNDAALAIGRAVAGSDAAFVEQMNALMTRLELRESRFVNAHGLDVAGHAASTLDLALLSRYALTLPVFADIVRASQWRAQGSRTIDVYNINGFLARYSGADGVKTGFTEDAGRTLVASATRGGRRVIVTLMNAPARYDDAQLLLDWVFENFTWR